MWSCFMTGLSRGRVETYTVEVAVQWPPNLRNTGVLQQFENLQIVKGITRKPSSLYTGKDVTLREGLFCVRGHHNVYRSPGGSTVRRDE